jgi:hypothetical protein
VAEKLVEVGRISLVRIFRVVGVNSDNRELVSTNSF